MHEERCEVRPPWPYRLPGPGRDGIARRRGGVLERVLHLDGEPALLRAAQPSPERVVLGAWAGRADVARAALERWRWSLGVDDDLGAFCERFRWDPLIGASVRRRPHLRLSRRAEPFEALAWAITEQLIEVVRAHAIQRCIVNQVGRRHGDLRDAPSAGGMAGVATARFCGWGLAERRAITLRRASEVVDRRGMDLRALRAIPGVGTWTLEMTALHGLGRSDVVPAGDLGLLKLVGRLDAGGDPEAHAEETRVREVFERYGPWKGLAAAHAMGARPTALAVPAAA